MRLISGPEELVALAGAAWGHSEWHQITQEQIDQFADATLDHQWIHVDVARSKRGPFQGTIAHGFLTLALIPHLTEQVAAIQGFRMAINYGLNRVRFPSPVPAGSRIRAAIVNISVEDVGPAYQVINETTIEIEGIPKPACVAQTVARFYR